MSRVSLFDGNHVEQAAAARLDAPHALHIRKPRFLDSIPNLRRAHKTLGQRFVRWRPPRPRATKNGIIAVINSFNAHHGSIRSFGAVISHPLAERTFGLDIAGMNKT